jgi:hypothetical protein
LFLVQLDNFKIFIDSINIGIERMKNVKMLIGKNKFQIEINIKKVINASELASTNEMNLNFSLKIILFIEIPNTVKNTIKNINSSKLIKF